MQGGQPQDVQDTTGRSARSKAPSPPATSRLWVALQKLQKAAVEQCTCTPSTSTGTTLERPQTHNLPAGVIWRICALIAICVAITNFAIIQATYFLMSWKKTALQLSLDDHGVAVGTLVLLGCNALAAATGSILVVWLAPVCAGGGLPEMKGYLNGNSAHGLFRARNFFVRLFGTIASVLAGLPIGREGPSISLGCNIGYGVVQLLAKSHVRRWVNVSSAGSHRSVEAMIVDEGRFLHAKRLGCALGGAAGMAAIFDAPVGGLLYMLEEVTEAAWTPELTLCTIAGTVVCVFVNRALISLERYDITEFLIYVTGPQVVEWGWADLPGFIILAVLLGVFGSLLTYFLQLAFTMRQRLSHLLQRWHPAGRVAECVVQSVVCGLVFILVSLAVSCRDSHSAGLMRFTCPDGQYNPAAVLLLAGPEESIKQFYSKDHAMEYSALILVFTSYTALFVGTIGLAIPMGTFIPAMFIGGAIGRIYGKLLSPIVPWGAAQPHIYAVVGSAAMLSAFTRQTLAIVVFMIECINDLHLIPPLMLTVLISHRVAAFVLPSPLDERLIELKGVPFLESDIPESVEKRGLVAADLCDNLPDDALLTEEATVKEVEQLLAATQASIFPVLRQDFCIGLATRPRLQAAVRAFSSPSQLGFEPSRHSLPSLSEHGAGEDSPGQPADTGEWGAEVSDVNVDRMISSLLSHDASSSAVVTEEDPDHGPSRGLEESPLMPFSRLMDTAPYTVLDNMPAARLYPLFSRLGIRAVCVIAVEGRFRGVISRDGLIAHTQRLCRSPHCPSKTETKPSDSTSRRSLQSTEEQELERGFGMQRGNSNDDEGHSPEPDAANSV